MKTGLLFRRIGANFNCKFDEFWTFKVDLLIDVLNTVLEVAMWFFLAQIVDPETLGYENVGYLPFILVGSVAIFFVDSVYANFTDKFHEDKTSGIYKLAYLSNMGVVEYFIINFVVSTFFDIITIFIPMVFTYMALMQFVSASTTLFFGFSNVMTLFIALIIFLIGNLGFQLMIVGSVLFLKRGDPVSFFMEQFNRLFSGQLFPISFLPKFLLFLPKILPSAYIILIWRETLFKNKILTDPSVMNLIFAGLIINIIVFLIGLYVFYYGVNRAKTEGRWF